MRPTYHPILQPGLLEPVLSRNRPVLPVGVGGRLWEDAAPSAGSLSWSVARQLIFPAGKYRMVRLIEG